MSYSRNWEQDYTYEDFGDTDYLVTDKRGYDSVINYLLGEIDTQLVLTEHKVSEINRSKEMVTVVTEKGSFTGYHVIVTASLGVLNSGMISFDPPLPDRKV